MRTRYLLLGVAIALGACKDDKPAGTAGGSAAPVPAPATKPAEPAPAAPTGTCDLVGTLELRRVTPAAGCGQEGRYATLTVEIAAVSPRGDLLELELADPMALGNVMATAESAAAPAGGVCAVTVAVSDAGRADDDEAFTYTVSVPPGGGVVKGTLEHTGASPDGDACTSQSAVEGTFTPGAPGGAAGSGGLDGPHASLDAYCKHRIAGFAKAACESPAEGDMCSCEPAGKDRLSGTIAASGKGGAITEAALLLVADDHANYVECEVALKAADGWHVLRDAFPCDLAPVAHDGELTVNVDRLAIAGDELRLAWTVDGKKAELTCTAASGKAPSCSPPAP